MMNLRIMNQNDYNAVYHLWCDTSGMGMRSLDDSPEGIERFLSRNPTSCFVAELDNQIVGVILCGHDGRRGYIYHVAVKTGHRNKGAGRTLVDAALDALKKEKINKVALVAFHSNETGNHFWEAMGFETRNDLVYRNMNLNENNR